MNQSDNFQLRRYFSTHWKLTDFPDSHQLFLLGCWEDFTICQNSRIHFFFVVIMEECSEHNGEIGFPFFSGKQGVQKFNSEIVPFFFYLLIKVPSELLGGVVKLCGLDDFSHDWNLEFTRIRGIFSKNFEAVGDHISIPFFVWVVGRGALFQIHHLNWSGSFRLPHIKNSLLLFGIRK